MGLPWLQQAQQAASRQNESGLFEIRFKVPQDLVGEAIGKSGYSIKSAREVPGVQSIDIDYYKSLFIIRGEVSGSTSSTCSVKRLFVVLNMGMAEMNILKTKPQTYHFCRCILHSQE